MVPIFHLDAVAELAIVGVRVTLVVDRDRAHVGLAQILVDDNSVELRRCFRVAADLIAVDADPDISDGCSLFVFFHDFCSL